jgi:hypothetical protein
MSWHIRAVGMTGFEPAAPCSQSWCATKLRHIPKATESCGSSARAERTTRLELATFCLEGRDSNQLSYVRMLLAQRVHNARLGSWPTAPY